MRAEKRSGAKVTFAAPLEMPRSSALRIVVALMG
jgi:hypothetical protein